MIFRYFATLRLLHVAAALLFYAIRLSLLFAADAFAAHA